jgi:hypothetical protein
LREGTAGPHSSLLWIVVGTEGQHFENEWPDVGRSRDLSGRYGLSRPLSSVLAEGDRKLLFTHPILRWGSAAKSQRGSLAGSIHKAFVPLLSLGPGVTPRIVRPAYAEALADGLCNPIDRVQCAKGLEERKGKTSGEGNHCHRCQRPRSAGAARRKCCLVNECGSEQHFGRAYLVG